MEPNTEAVAYEFTPTEFERLGAFRQAVLAGFYTDELDEDEAELPSDIASYAELMAAVLESDP
jgi:hypothetical protein